MQYKIKGVAAALVASGVLLGSNQALANDSDELEKLRALVQELDQKVKILDRKGELADEAAAAKKKETPIVKASEKGFGFQSADGNFEIKLRGIVQTDYRYFDKGFASTGSISGNTFNPGADAANTFLVRRARPTVEGTVFEKYDFRITPEFGDDKTTSNSGVVDAYVDARWASWFQLRAGKFKPYVGLERLQSAADIKFLERSYVTNALLPNRDVGASLHGDLFDNKLSYGLGLFNGVVDGGDSKTSASSNKNKDIDGRLFATPFQGEDSVLAGLGFGIGATYGTPVGATSGTTVTDSNLTSGYKTNGQQTFFKYNANTYADGKRYRWSPQAYYYYGPFGLLAEYARADEEVNTKSPTASLNNKSATLGHEAWQVAGTYLLTGEDASFKGVKPKQPFDLNNGGWGAWEVALRYSELNLDDKIYNLNKARTAGLYTDPRTSAKSAHSWSAGVNWYLNTAVKVALDYEDTTFSGGGGGTLINPNDREDERALLARFQIAY